MTTTYPPCVEHILQSMSNNEKISHAAKLLVGTYLLSQGRSVDEIIETFRGCIDFKERVFRYQVEHLAGLKGSCKCYDVPSCQKLLNQNLCYATEECNGIFNPKNFGNKK